MRSVFLNLTGIHMDNTQTPTKTNTAISETELIEHLTTCFNNWYTGKSNVESFISMRETAGEDKARLIGAIFAQVQHNTSDALTEFASKIADATIEAYQKGLRDGRTTTLSDASISTVTDPAQPQKDGSNVLMFPKPHNSHD